MEMHLGIQHTQEILSNAGMLGVSGRQWVDTCHMVRGSNFSNPCIDQLYLCLQKILRSFIPPPNCLHLQST